MDQPSSPADDPVVDGEGTSAEELAGFGTDDLGRVQNILLGDHARRTSERLDTLELALLGAIDDLRAEMRKRVEALENRITSEESVRTTALANVTDRLDTVAAGLTKEIATATERQAAQQTKALTNQSKKQAKALKDQADKHAKVLAEHAETAALRSAEQSTALEEEVGARNAALGELRQLLDDQAEGQDAKVAGINTALGDLAARTDEDSANHADSILRARQRIEDEAVRSAALADELAATDSRMRNDLGALESAFKTQLREVRDRAAERSDELSGTKVDRRALQGLLHQLAEELEQPDATE